jgi:NAD(P)-dependent dehydrogenase (short-subunit alcohol dehydrogenase family)
MKGSLQPAAFDLSGRVALLTGSGRGIGLGMARALAAHGAAVAIQDIDLDVAESEAQASREAGGKALALGGDVTDLALPARVVAEVLGQLGRLDILVNNAAIQKSVEWTEIAIDDARRQLEANVIAPLLFAREALPAFRRGGYGRILNIGSIQGKTGNPGMIAYSMSKAALANMTTALARAVAREGFTVNLLAPGYFNTYRNRGDFKTEQDLKEKGKWVPLGRIGEPEDFAGIAVMLASPSGGYITGQVIYVDGGMSAR